MKKNIFTIVVTFFTLIALAFFCFVLSSSVLYAPSDEIALPLSYHQQIAAHASSLIGNPARLRVPSIGVNAYVQDVGITKKGNMATPNNFTDVGWFRYGPTPGEMGSAVIAGHVDNGLSLPAVFANLKNVHKGDVIYVDTAQGQTVVFKVTGMDTYAYNAPADAIFNQNDGKYLKLITCTGVWVDALKTHDKRLVITAEKV